MILGPSTTVGDSCLDHARRTKGVRVSKDKGVGGGLDRGGGCGALGGSSASAVVQVNCCVVESDFWKPPIRRVVDLRFDEGIDRSSIRYTSGFIMRRHFIARWVGGRAKGWGPAASSRPVSVLLGRIFLFRFVSARQRTTRQDCLRFASGCTWLFWRPVPCYIHGPPRVLLLFLCWRRSQFVVSFCGWFIL